MKYFLCIIKSYIIYKLKNMENKKSMPTCYICGAPYHSTEHAPARCFFPKDKRDSPITVPSCKLHNEDTSIDDEYVRVVIASSIGNNKVAESHFLNSCIKTLNRSEALTKILAANSKYIWVSEGDQKPRKELSIRIDRSRLNKIVRKIGYAIFYNKHQQPWMRKLNIGTEWLLRKDNSNDNLGILIQQAKKVIDFSTITFEGSHPTVFKYVFMPADGTIYDQVLVMIFYEGFEVWCFPDPSSEAPEL
jgi:hypothetical protein